MINSDFQNRKENGIIKRSNRGKKRFVIQKVASFKW